MTTARNSWVAAANDPASDFPIQNLPYGVFHHQGKARIGIAIGDQILDLAACVTAGMLAKLPGETVAACSGELLNPLMALGPAAWAALRRRVREMLDADEVSPQLRERIGALLVPMRDALMLLPAQVGDYTDFYASIHHATRVGKLFRPDNPLLQNYKYVPIGYHGRASSIVVSGEQVRRPWGQTKAARSAPVFGPSRALDYELEVGAFVGPGNRMGEAIPIGEAEEHVFGLCLLNDWSARDMQAWESQPLGPFLAKSFATTISPWVVPMEALVPYRVPVARRADGDPAPLPHLTSPSGGRDGIDLTLEVWVQSQEMRRTGMGPILLSKGNLRDLYWSIGQLVTHHASNGCNLRPGDLIATGTISGSGAGSEGCLLEKTLDSKPICLPSGEKRDFIEDGDTVTFRAYTEGAGLPRIGFGDCSGTLLAAHPGV